MIEGTFATGQEAVTRHVGASTPTGSFRGTWHADAGVKFTVALREFRLAIERTGRLTKRLEEPPQ